MALTDKPDKRDGNGSRSAYLKWPALVVTNAIKIAGLYVGVHEALQDTPDSKVLVFAAFMMAGAQISEEVLMTFLGSFFGRNDRDRK
jgi:hypothetical protein